MHNILLTTALFNSILIRYLDIARVYSILLLHTISRVSYKCVE